ncbi:MAG TPA: hypothetical protein VMU81_15735 [Acetobacteraceae bacterium]|jgi:hypothetical protein|nr:hypothetical protein [Acetobacteraceae bacterium]
MAGKRAFLTWDLVADGEAKGASGLYFYGYQWWLGRSLVQGQSVGWVLGLRLGGSGCT